MTNVLARKQAEDVIEYNAGDYSQGNPVINIVESERRYEKLKLEIEAIMKKWQQYKNKYGGTKR